jgi:putative protease
VEIVTRVYKQALRDIEAGTYTKERIEQYYEELKTVYNRGLSRGNYYLGRELEAYSDVHGSKATKEKRFVGTVKKYFAKAGVAEVVIEAGEVATGADILIIGATTGVYEGTIAELRDADEQVVEKVEKGTTATFQVSERVRVNDRMYLWKDKLKS